ncbi:sensor histidine kinase [Oleiharenicola lentus]|uniref:sensor histidine kinase n=1 Tax=Oleiharenicola lentus TaxID=2508720 RepID=UPI003F66EE77
MPENRRLAWRFLFGVWSALGLLLILQSYVATAGDGRDFTFTQHVMTVASQFYRAWIWAGLTPVIFWLRRELNRRHSNLVVVIALHFLAAVTCFAMGNVVRIWIIEITFGYWELRFYALSAVYTQLGAYSLIDFYIYWAILLVAYVTDVNWQRRQTELREEQLRTQLSQAELAALKQQVQPHFLFNSLNAIASLVREGQPTKSIEALAKLSSLLRQLMNYSGRPEIELWREYDYAQCYLAVEQVRFEERLVTKFDADEECLQALVPTLILQPLVENAVKHGIAQRRNPGRVTVTARRLGDRLQLQVANDPAEGGRHASEAENHGIGLSSTRTRLELTYGQHQKLEAVLNGPAGSIITIEIPLRFPEAAEKVEPISP